MPWGPWRVAGGMVGWAGSFLLVGGVLVPAALLAVGVDLRTLPVDAKAQSILLLQAAETAAGLATVYAFVRPDVPLAEDAQLFRWTIGRPTWSLREGWAGWALGGYLSSFLVRRPIARVGAREGRGKGIRTGGLGAPRVRRLRPTHRHRERASGAARDTVSSDAGCVI